MSICTYLTEITGSFCRKRLGTGRGNSVGSRCSLRMQAAPISTLASDKVFQGECLPSFLKKSKLYVTIAKEWAIDTERLSVSCVQEQC